MPSIETRLSGNGRLQPQPNPVAEVHSTGHVSDILGRYADRVVEARAPAVDAARRVVAREVKLADDGSLFLSPTGYLVTKAGQAQPPTAIEMGDALYQAANRYAERDINLYAKAGITTEHKALSLTALHLAFNSTLNQVPVAGGFQNEQQRLQLRSCVAPLILDLAVSTSNTASGKALKTRALQVYFDALKQETNAQNRNFMIYDLDRKKAQLPAEVRPVISDLMKEVAQTDPPYEKWFANGNNKLVIDYNVGAGFWEEETQFWIEQGFARRDNPDGSMTLSKALESDGKKTNFELVMRNSPDGMFQKMNDPNVHVVVYSGHANYGRHVLNRIQAGKPLEGAKVFFGLQCGGKYVHNAILEKYDGLQVVQSKNSSYGHQDRYTLLHAMEGFTKRQSWAQIADKNERENSDNYYFPHSALVRKKAEDRDHDGIVDAWDRVVQHNTFKPQAGIDRELTAQDPGVAAERIDGRGLSAALQRVLRVAGYNDYAEDLQNQRVITNGFVEGGARAPLLEIGKARDADGPLQVVTVNKFYAHASESSFGAVLSYTIGQQAALAAGAAPDLAKANGLVMAAKCLDIDTSQVDQQIWQGLIKFQGLPAGLRMEDALAAAKADEHMTAGTRATVRGYLDRLKAGGVQL